MPDPRAPLRLEYLSAIDGLSVVRQSPPASAASFAATYVAPAGWAFDDDGAEGTARLVNQLATSAAGAYDRVELARLLDRAGATLSRQCAPESAELSIWGPAADWEKLLGLLALVVQKPRFAAEDLERARRQLVEGQLRETSQPAQRADRELLGRIFPPGHPYHATGLGNRRSIRRLTQARLRRFHREHYTGDGGLVVVTAPARGPAVERAVRRAFGRFARDRAPPAPRAPAVTPGTSTRLVPLPGHSQVEVRLGGPSLARADPRFPAAFLANEVLGGRPLLARLFQGVREKKGLAYHASSDLEAMRWGGYWVAQAGTGGDRWKKVLAALEKELQRIRDEAPTDRELRLVRESGIGEIVLDLESTSGAHELAVDAAYHHLPPAHWIDWPDQLRRVRPTELRDAAAAAFGRAGQVAVVAGPLDSPR